MALLLFPAAHAAARPAEKGLTRAEAAARAQRIGPIHYTLSFKLEPEAEGFTGTIDADFHLVGASTPLTLDFAEGKVLSLTVNGAAIEPSSAYNGFFVTLPESALREGSNNILVAFSHPYSKTGAGLYRFKDPVDARTYVYTDFEPYDANLLFPCFDQPDLKARYTMTVDAPQDWQVISSVRESSIGKGPAGFRRWEFPASALFSTYLFSLHAGPYVTWTSTYTDVPLRLFARQSMAQYIDVDDWFKVTREGLGFYEAYFDYPYPFDKYDQLIVPDFNSGAMENVAAVTFSERYIQRGVSTWRDRHRRANVILHEMAHMWFGNLVTMRWWDDLWLNESFASYMASLALKEATEFHDSWQDFFQGMKQWAYWEDGLVTTHPIEADVPDTESAFSAFDGITYGKGASVLKQASYAIGPDKFRDGARRYFEEHAFGNAVRADFIAALEAASGKDLSSWTKEWIGTAGLNSVSAEFTCRDGKIDAFKLVQGAPSELPALRGHRTQIGLFSEGDWGTLRPAASVENADYAGPATEQPSLVGQTCPDLVFPNLGDHDYAEVRLDPRSLAAVKTRLSDVEDGLDRAMLWMTLWNMVRHSKLSVTEYADIALRHLPRETSFQTRAAVLETIYGRRLNSVSVLRLLADDEKAFSDYGATLSAKLEALFWERLNSARPGSDDQQLWLDAFIRVAATPEGQNKLRGLLEGKDVPSQLDLDQDKRWDIVSQLNRRDAAGSKPLIALELKRDKSRRGETEAIRAEVMRPDWGVKRAWLDRITAEDSKVPLAELKAAMQAVFPYEQAALHRRFAGEFYGKLVQLAKSKPEEFLGDYAENLVPATCRKADSDALGAYVARDKELGPVILKELRVALQENGRCLAVRELARPALAR